MLAQCHHIQEWQIVIRCWYGKCRIFAKLLIMHQFIVILRGHCVINLITERIRPIIARTDLINMFLAYHSQIMHNVAAADNQHTLFAQGG